MLLSLTASFQNALKYAQNRQKLRIKRPKIRRLQLGLPPEPAGRWRSLRHSSGGPDPQSAGDRINSDHSLDCNLTSNVPSLEQKLTIFWITTVLDTINQYSFNKSMAERRLADMDNRTYLDYSDQYAYE